MTRDQLFQRRQSNARHELRLLIAGVVGAVAAVIALLNGKFGVAAAIVVLSAVAFGLARIFVILDGLADQLESVERRLQERTGAEGEGASKGGP